MPGWNASNKFCHFLGSGHWLDMTKQLRAPKALGHLVHIKVTDAELRESERLKLLNMVGILSPRNRGRS